MAGQYAASTDVAPDRSRAEIEGTLRRYGATQFAYGWDEAAAVLGFVANGRQVRFVVPMPDPKDPTIARTETGKPRAPAALKTALEQATRQRWRALALVVKAKLEAVASGLISFEDEFLPYTVLPGGGTVADALRDKMTAAYETGEVPSLLPAYGTDGPLALTSR